MIEKPFFSPWLNVVKYVQRGVFYVSNANAPTSSALRRRCFAVGCRLCRVIPRSSSSSSSLDSWIKLGFIIQSWNVVTKLLLQEDIGDLWESNNDNNGSHVQYTIDTKAHTRFNRVFVVHPPQSTSCCCSTTMYVVASDFCHWIRDCMYFAIYIVESWLWRGGGLGR